MSRRRGASVLTGVGLSMLLALVLCGRVAGAQGTTTTSPTTSPTNGQTVRVAVVVEPPFVEKQNAGYSGFSVDLWEEIARRNSYKTEYIEKPNVQEQLETVRAGQADIAIG